MQEEEHLLRSIRSTIDTRPRNHHDAATLGYELFAFLSQHCIEDRIESELRNAFQQYIVRHSFDDLLTQHIDYAKRIARSKNTLLYEEMLKLFYLCDEIKALSSLAFRIVPTEEKDLIDALKERFAREPRKSQLAAKQNVEPWKSDWWWYACNLSSGE